MGSLVGAMDGLTVVGSLLVGEIDGFCCIIIADILVYGAPEHSIVWKKKNQTGDTRNIFLNV